jgi:hypothetical protein
LFFKVDIRYAIGASLVSVIATSSGAAAAYVKEGFSNIRIGMFLEIATHAGRAAWGISRDQSARRCDCDYLRIGVGVFRVFVEASQGQAARRRDPRSPRHPLAVEWQFSYS